MNCMVFISLGSLTLIKAFFQSHILKAKKTVDANALKAFDTPLFLGSFMIMWKKITKDNNIVKKLHQSLAKFEKSRKPVTVSASASALTLASGEVSASAGVSGQAEGNTFPLMDLDVSHSSKQPVHPTLKTLV